MVKIWLDLSSVNSWLQLVKIRVWVIMILQDLLQIWGYHLDTRSQVFFRDVLIWSSFSSGWKSTFKHHGVLRVFLICVKKPSASSGNCVKSDSASVGCEVWKWLKNVEVCRNEVIRPRQPLCWRLQLKALLATMSRTRKHVALWAMKAKKFRQGLKMHVIKELLHQFWFSLFNCRLWFWQCFRVEAEKVCAVFNSVIWRKQSLFSHGNGLFMLLSRENKRLTSRDNNIISQNHRIIMKNWTNECLAHLIINFSLQDLRHHDCREDS